MWEFHNCQSENMIKTFLYTRKGCRFDSVTHKIAVIDVQHDHYPEDKDCYHVNACVCWVNWEAIHLPISR
jgi:hypothetical protein